MNKRMYIERRTLTSSSMTELATDLTLHMYARQFEGYIVVVAEEPFLLLRVVRKQWLKLIRSVQRERSKTLNALRIAQLSHNITKMQELRFATKTPAEEPLARVFFVRLDQVGTSFPLIDTHYICPGVDIDAAIQCCQQVLRPNGLFVTYQIIPVSPKKPEEKAIF